MGFQEDLEAGVSVEEDFVKFLASMGIRSGRNTATTLTEKRFYDVYDLHGVTYELKFDRRAQETQNIYLEHAGLGKSRADYIVYKLKGDKNFYILDRPTVLTFLESPQFKVVSGGDKWGAGTLIPLKEFRKLFKIVEKETKKPKKKVNRKT